MADRVQWGGTRRKAFIEWMQTEVMRVLAQRDPLARKWRKWLQQYRAPADKGTAHFPFEGASNREYPLTAMNVDPVWARFMQNIHAPNNLWTCVPLNEQWINVAKPLQDYLQWMDMHILKMWDVNMRIFPEMLKLGTSIYKTYWHYQRRNIVGYDANKQRQRFAETVNKPVVDHVPIDNFLIPPEAQDIDPDKQGGAQWVAERHRVRIPQLEAMAKGQAPFLPNFDPSAVKEVREYYEQGLTDMEQKKQELQQTDGAYYQQANRPIEIWEVHARFDTTGNGIEDDIVVFWHQESQTILRATYQILKRPFTAVRYLRGDGFYGIGISEQLEMWQSTVSDVLNFNIDKILLSNAPMFRASEGANVAPNEPIFPGKIWYGEKDELEPFFMVAPGSFDINTLQAFLQDGAKQRSGLTDLQYGTIGSLPSRTPATTVTQMLQEGNTRFDMSMKDTRIALGEVGLSVLQHIQMNARDLVNNPDGQDYVRLAARILGEPEGQFVAQALMIPQESIELGVGVQLTATSGASNKELMKQSNLALLQLFTQLGPSFIQLAALAQQGGPVGETAINLFEGARQLSMRVLEQFDVTNPEEIVPNVQALLQAQGQMAAGQPISPLNSGGGQPDQGLSSLFGL
jgi:hypothetical protein